MSCRQKWHRLQGAEFEAQYALAKDLMFDGAVAYHNARYTRFTTVDDQGNPVAVGGNELTMSPRILTSVGLLYTPPQGVNVTLVASYVGHRWLDEENTAPASGYVTLDGTLSYRSGRYEIALEGTNLVEVNKIIPLFRVFKKRNPHFVKHINEYTNGHHPHHADRHDVVPSV